MDVKVLGAGCARCRQLLEVTRQAVAEAGLGVTVEYIDDMTRILEHDVLMTPALVVDGKVRCGGRVPPVAEIAGWLREAAGKAG